MQSHKMWFAFTIQVTSSTSPLVCNEFFARQSTNLQRKMLIIYSSLVLGLVRSILSEIVAHWPIRGHLFSECYFWRRLKGNVMPKIRESKVTIFLSRREELENNLLTWCNPSIILSIRCWKFFRWPINAKTDHWCHFLNLVRCLYGFW